MNGFLTNRICVEEVDGCLQNCLEHGVVSNPATPHKCYEIARRSQIIENETNKSEYGKCVDVLSWVVLVQVWTGGRYSFGSIFL